VGLAIAQSTAKPTQGSCTKDSKTFYSLGVTVARATRLPIPTEGLVEDHVLPRFGLSRDRQHRCANIAAATSLRQLR